MTHLNFHVNITLDKYHTEWTGKNRGSILRNLFAAIWRLSFQSKWNSALSLFALTKPDIFNKFCRISHGNFTNLEQTDWNTQFFKNQYGMWLSETQ